MNDQELADAVVALGIGSFNGSSYILPEPAYLDGMTAQVSPLIESVPAELFVRDWRVAGALMEKAYEKIELPQVIDRAHDVLPATGSLSRAIIEACVGALS